MKPPAPRKREPRWAQWALQLKEETQHQLAVSNQTKSMLSRHQQHRQIKSTTSYTASNSASTTTRNYVGKTPSHNGSYKLPTTLKTGTSPGQQKIKSSSSPVPQPSAFRVSESQAPTHTRLPKQDSSSHSLLQKRHVVANQKQEQLAFQQAQQAQQAAEWCEVQERYRITQAAALERERTEKRKAQLRRDPSANYRHILEVYKLMPLDRKRGEHVSPYLLRLLANRPMPEDQECELALAITYAKDHWGDYAMWPKDVKRYAEYERERRKKMEKK